MKVGRDGLVDVWCVDSAAGDTFYRQHLGLLDGSVMGHSQQQDEEDEEDEVWVAAAAGVPDSIRTRTPLGQPGRLYRSTRPSGAWPSMLIRMLWLNSTFYTTPFVRP